MITIKGIPRRIDQTLTVRCENAITEAMKEVECLGADVKLTEAIMLMTQARNLVSDFVDERLSQ